MYVHRRKAEKHILSGHKAPSPKRGCLVKFPRNAVRYPKDSLSYGLSVYRFSHQVLADLVHLAHTAAKRKTNVFTRLVGVSVVNTDDMQLTKYEKKFMQMAVKIMNAVFSFMNEHGRCFQPKSLLSRAKSHSLAPRLLYVSITLFSSLSQSFVMMQR